VRSVVRKSGLRGLKIQDKDYKFLYFPLDMFNKLSIITLTPAKLDVILEGEKFMSVWSIQDGKTRFSELIKKSGRSAQFITLHGKPTAVVISQEEYSRLVKPNLLFLSLCRLRLWLM
jgi:prevent-host-death family protein